MAGKIGLFRPKKCLHSFNHVIITFHVIFAWMIPRQLESQVLNTLKTMPSVALIGPRQVGKTTLALRIGEQMPSVYLDLENRGDALRVQDFSLFFNENRDKLIILDEVQRTPELFRELRGLIDRERRTGRKTGMFLFLGSASIDLLKQSGESLAGRIAYLELFPLNWQEYGTSEPNQLNNLWNRGGFPDSLLAASDADSMTWRRNFIRTYLERDIPSLGPRVPAQTLDRFWTMLAHQQGSMINTAQLARNIDVSATTAHRYIDLMADLLLVRRLQPWSANAGKRLVRSPKVYIRDSGIVHALLNIIHLQDLTGHPVCGASWEGMVIENILSVCKEHVRTSFYRSAQGAEIDLILQSGTGNPWAIEIKRSSDPSVSRGFHQACEDIGAEKRFVVYAGSEKFSIGRQLTAIPLAEMMKLALTL